VTRPVSRTDQSIPCSAARNRSDDGLLLGDLSRQSQAAGTPEKLPAGQTECSGRLGLVAVRLPEGLHDHLLLDFIQGTNVRPGGASPKPALQVAWRRGAAAA